MPTSANLAETPGVIKLVIAYTVGTHVVAIGRIKNLSSFFLYIIYLVASQVFNQLKRRRSTGDVCGGTVWSGRYNIIT